MHHRRHLSIKKVKEKLRVQMPIFASKGNPEEPPKDDTGLMFVESKSELCRW